MNKTIAELHSLLVKGEATASELTEECISLVMQDKCNSFEATCFDKARKQASKITEVRENEYLKGIPFFSKDNYSHKGVETTASSDMLKGYVPLFDATVITKLERAGMILVAHTTMDELAMGGTGTTGHKGTTLNPFDKERTIGGSSCGSAAALAQGFAPFALGSDTGDSVRRPASNAGLIGFKPTWGRISRYGLFPFAPSMDTVGYFTRSVLDASYVLSVLSGHDEKDMSSSVRRKEKYEDYVLERRTLHRIGYFRSVLDGIKDENIRKAYDELLRKLEDKGYEIIDYDFPVELLNSLYPCYMIISCAEAGSNNACLDGIRFGPKADGDPKTYEEYMINARTKGFSELIKRRFLIGSFALLSQNQEEMFTRAQKVRRLIAEKMNLFFDEVDYLILPAVSEKPKKLCDLTDRWPEKPSSEDHTLLLANLGGFPSISVPLTLSDHMPIGIQITGRIFEDGYVLSMADEIERTLQEEDE